MVNPGVFHGKRKEFLLAEQDGYAQAVKEDRGHRAAHRHYASLPEAISDIHARQH